MSIAAPFPYFIEPDISHRNPTGVFKLYFGKKYFIFKGLRIAYTVETLSKQLHREKNDPKEDSILFKVVAYVRKARITNMTVDVVFEQDNIMEVLMAEYEALQAAKDDPDCLNTRFINNEYFPNWVPQYIINDFNKAVAGKKPINEVKNLRRFLSNHVEDAELVDRIVEYVKGHFRGAAPRKSKHESNKNISQK